MKYYGATLRLIGSIRGQQQQQTEIARSVCRKTEGADPYCCIRSRTSLTNFLPSLQALTLQEVARVITSARKQHIYDTQLQPLPTPYFESSSTVYHTLIINL